MSTPPTPTPAYHTAPPAPQDIPLVNTGDSAMTVGASIAGSPWTGPREVVVPAGATVVYPLQFKPLVSGEAGAWGPCSGGSAYVACKEKSWPWSGERPLIVHEYNILCNACTLT